MPPLGSSSRAPFIIAASIIPGSQAWDGEPHEISEQVIRSVGQERLCVWCARPFRQTGYEGRFCGRSCSAKWRMNTPEYKAKVHTPEVAARRGRSHSIWLRETPEG